MKISVLTLFPEMFSGVFDSSIIKRAQEKKLVYIEYVNIRDFGIGHHNMVDDKPYGGGVGMVMKVDVVHKAIEKAKCKPSKKCKEKVLLLDPAGKTFRQEIARKLVKADHLIFVCGRYEGIDDRVRSYVDMELSIGDFVLTGGEIPTMVVVDAITRLIPGVLEKNEAIAFESFSKDENLLEYPQYTRPQNYQGKEIPSVLRSGNHKEVETWRKRQSLARTKKRRPDLINSS